MSASLNYFNGSSSTTKSNLLLWKRCIYMTQAQYKSNRHINPNMLCIKGITTNVDNYVTTQITNIANRLLKNKVPAPIYVMYAKKLEFNETIFEICITEAKSFEVLIQEESSLKSQLESLKSELSSNESQLKAENSKQDFSRDINKLNKLTQDIAHNNNNKNTIEVRLREIERIKKNFSCITKDNYQKYLKISQNLYDDINTLYSSEIAKFTFKNNYEVYIYIPNLNKNSEYFTNFKDFSVHNNWINTIIKNALLYNLLNLSNPDINRLKLLYDKASREGNRDKMPLIQKIIRLYLLVQEKDYPLSKELTASCFNEGCVSDYGEELDRIVPEYSKDAGQAKTNANNKAPYYPTRCLKQPNYKDNMFDENNQYNKKLKEYLLGDCLKNYYESVDKLNRGDLPNGNVNSLLIDQLKSCTIEYRRNEYGSFDNNTGTDKFSVEYNKKILTELAVRRKGHPGVQEVIFPFFRLNDQHPNVINHITYMPWGNKLLTNSYILNEDESLYENNALYSFNNNFKLILPTKNVSPELLNKICVFNNNIIYYTLSDTIFDNYVNKNFKLESGGVLNLYGSVIRNNKYVETSIWKLVTADNYVAISPITLSIDEYGRLAAYDNGFNNVNSVVLNNRIEKSIGNYNGTTYVSTDKIDSDIGNSFDDFMKKIKSENIFSATSIMPDSTDTDDYMGIVAYPSNVQHSALYDEDSYLNLLQK